MNPTDEQRENIREQLGVTEDRLPRDEVMMSHDLAKALATLPNRRVVVVLPAGDEYVRDFEVEPGSPWIGPFGEIRIQIRSATREASK